MASPTRRSAPPASAPVSASTTRVTWSASWPARYACPRREILEALRALDRHGRYVIHEVWLSPDEMTALA